MIAACAGSAAPGASASHSGDPSGDSRGSAESSEEGSAAGSSTTTRSSRSRDEDAERREDGEGERDDERDDRGDGDAEAAALAARTTAAIHLTGTALGTIFWLGADNLPPDDARAAREITRRWLAAHRSQLAVDLALGGGRVLDDLAGAARIAHARRGRLGRRLRAHRHELLNLCCQPGGGGGRALDFVERAGAIAREDAALVADYRRFVRDPNGGAEIAVCR